MDRKSLIVVALSVLLLVAYKPLVDRFYPTKPRQVLTNQVSQVRGGISNNPVLVNSAERVGTTSALPQASQAPTLLSVTHDNLIYTFTSQGGGIQLIELTNHQALILCGVKTPPPSRFASLNTRAHAPILSFLGGEAIVGDGVFELSRTASGVRAQKLLTNGLSLTKDFSFGTNYLVTVKTRLENKSTEVIGLPPQEVVVGTATPINHLDIGQQVGLFWYNGAKAEHITAAWFENKTLGCFAGTPRAEFLAGANNVDWAAVHNQFFTIAAVPGEKAPQVLARQVEIPFSELEMLEARKKSIKKHLGFQTAFLYPSVVLNPAQSQEKSFQIYAGPKEYNTLARFGHEMKNDLDAVMDFGFFGVVAKALLLSMNKLHSWGVHYGVAIIIITVIIKLLFWPLTTASTRSMKRLQALQPQMKEIQTKYKEDPAKMNQKTMEFMKANKVNPLGGCLPLLLQFPVFIGFYQMLQSAIELRGVSFLWAADLAQADTVAFAFGFPINPMPLIYGVTLFWSANLTPPSPGMDPMQQKMMKYMPVIFLVFLYNMASGLTLYWTVQNLLTILQTKLTKANETKDPTAPAKMVPVRSSLPKKKK